MEQDRDYSSVTRFWVRGSPIAQRTWANALRRVWSLLIFRDHWQGEFCVALCGGLGWAFLGLISDQPLATPLYGVVTQVAPQWLWELAIGGSAAAQLYGLFKEDGIYFRVAGAAVLGAAFTAITLGLLLGPGPLLPGVALYVACAAIEYCAVILQTAVIFRDKGTAKWTSKP